MPVLSEFPPVLCVANRIFDKILIPQSKLPENRVSDLIYLCGRETILLKVKGNLIKIEVSRGKSLDRVGMIINDKNKLLNFQKQVRKYYMGVDGRNCETSKFDDSPFRKRLVD